MDSSPEDRLKAFLERNRNRINQQPTSPNITNFEKDVAAPPGSTDKAVSDIESTKSNSAFTEMTPINHGTRLEPRIFATQENERRGRSGNEPQALSTFYSTTSSESITHNYDTRNQQATETPKKSVMHQSAVLPRDSQPLPANRLSMTIDNNNKFQANPKKRGLSTSPLRLASWESELNTKTQSRIEKYIQDRKQARSKIRARVRSLSTENSAVLLKPFKQQNNVSNYSVKNKAYETLSRGSSSNYENQEDQTSLKSLESSSKLPRVQLSDILFAKEKKKPFSSTKSKISISSATAKREYCFEETEDARRRNKSRSGVHANSRSKSKTKSMTRSISRGVSPTPGSKNPRSRNETSVDAKLNGRGRSRDRSSNNSTPAQFFQESSKKLTVLDSSLDHGHKFKKEIKNLIGVIKREREQISGELEVMTKELKKYKQAYRALKNDVKSGKTTKKETSSIKSNGNSLNISKSVIEEKPPGKETGEKMSYPFTINELTQYIENSVPVHNEENIEDLLAKIDSVHTDVESILNKNDISIIKSPQKKGLDQKSFELRRTALNYFIVREMNLQPSLFFQDFNPDEVPDCKPNLIDLLSAQREIIYFLVKKLQIEEQQRLKTEEQASKMIYSMEKTEEKSSSIRKKEPFGQLDLNKSISSQMTSKFDTSDHIL